MANSDSLFDSLVYTCAFEQERGLEEFFPEHFVGLQIAGETHALRADGITVVPQDAVVLARRNQLIRTTKHPAPGGAYRFVSIVLDRATLQQYALENGIAGGQHYAGDGLQLFGADEFLRTFFLSLVPYAEQTQRATRRLIDLKIREAVELLRRLSPDTKDLLFDFNAPHKIDLEEFMEQHYRFNVPVERLATLTGRSVSGFKRDFTKTFQASPQQWLRARRLQEAYVLIRHKRQRAVDIYGELGFENLSHFYAAFKQQFGVTTSELAKTE